MRRGFAGLGAAALLALAGTQGPLPASAQATSVEVRSCEPHPVDPFLRRALVRVRTGAQRVSFSELRCGSFVPGTSDSLFLNGVDGLGILPPHTTRTVSVFFPGDERHSECRCAVDVPQTAALPPTPRDEPEADPRWRDEDWQHPDATNDDWPPEVFRGAPVEPRGTRGDDYWDGGWRELPDSRLQVLREEMVLPPSVAVRDAPEPESDEIDRLTSGTRVEVLAVEGGWKQVRTREDLEGFIPDDAATSDLGAPARLSRALAPLHAQLAPGATLEGETASLCSTLPEGSLDPLLFALLPEQRSAYVRSLWYALEEADRNAVRIYLSECYGVTRIVEIGSGTEVGKLTAEAPSRRWAARSGSLWDLRLASDSRLDAHHLEDDPSHLGEEGADALLIAPGNEFHIAARDSALQAARMRLLEIPGADRDTPDVRLLAP